VKIGDLGLSRGIAVDDETGEATHPSDELLTEYVVTRWYRAPEVLLARSKYGPPVDVWSVGCIVYEMCSRKALFPGKNSYDQLKRILAVIRSPQDADSSWVPRESMPLLQKCYPSGGSSSRGPGLAALCGSICSAEGVELLQLMCLFNPMHRIGVEQALVHPYLAGITSEQDRRTAKAVDPADVTYDKMFDGVGKQGEGAALVQLGRLLRREVAKYNPIRTDTTPERSQADRTPKTASNARTPRSGPPSAAEAVASAVGGCSARGSAGSKILTEPQQHASAPLGSSDRASSAHHHPQPPPADLTASVWHRRRSEPEADIWARRSGQGQVLAGPSRVGSTSSIPSGSGLLTRRRSADDGRPISDSKRQLDSDTKRVAPGEDPHSLHAPLSLPMAPPHSGPVPPSAFWVTEDKEKSPALKQSLRSARGGEGSGSVPSLRRKLPGYSGGSATTASTRATPPGSRPGTEASTRASSRITSTSRPRVPSVGPQSTAQWVNEPEGFLLGPAVGLGPADAATASPRAGPPMLLRGDSNGRQEEGQLSGRRPCWLGADEHGDSTAKAERGTQSHADRSSHRGLRESASASNPGLPPNLDSSQLRHESHSLACLDDVLREMKAMIKHAPDESYREREDNKQERERSRPAASKASCGSRPGSSRSATRSTTGLRGHRAAAVGRGGDTTEDRSPSTQRSSRRHAGPTRTEHAERERRTMGRQRSHDELDFAVAEAFELGLHGSDLPMKRTPQRGERAGHGEREREAWVESRKPLESMEPEHVSPRKGANNHPDLGPPMPWSRGGSVRNLQDGDQDWKNLQSSWNSAIVNGNGKVHGSGGQSQRQLSRNGSSVKRTSASENHNMSHANISGLGFVF
jgi:hypothetical protein